MPNSLASPDAHKISYDRLSQHFLEHKDVLDRTFDKYKDDLLLIGKIMAKRLSEGGTIFWCGNGGSAADSQHMAAELVGRFNKTRRALRSISLCTDTSILTCVANDYTYDEVFSRQIEALACDGDILVVLSTSGQSKNIITALTTAKSQNLLTISFLGRDGGTATSLSDHPIVVPSHSTPRIQEMHALLGHILCDLIEQNLGFV